MDDLASRRQLLDARLELLRAVVGFDTAQFRLFVAGGSTPSVPADASSPAVPVPPAKP